MFNVGGKQRQFAKKVHHLRTKTPAAFPSLKGYDGHFIMKETVQFDI